MNGELEGKVAIVTGAGTGLGRLHALKLASMGAAVVVNDLGAAVDGAGRDESKARAVVEEIEKAGGRAIAHFGDVADWKTAEEMVQSAVESFGDLHILVNNAGFTRDATIFNIGEEEFDSVVRVHLKGHFAPSKFACIYWRERAKKSGGTVYGRLLSTASEAFLFGNPGQPNYAAAKAGITSFTMGIAQLMLKYGVTANVVMPRARTRMTLQGPNIAIFKEPEGGFDTFHPEHVLPLFAYLCTPRAARVSGHLFIVWGREIKVIGRPEPKQVFHTEDAWSVDSVHAKLGPYFDGLEPVKDGFTVPPM
ncbi:MAG: SDR family NAD(P)-dependent oxidoreductase [Myxococcales bacterium]|jgi:3-oxoacyl-[acyl-carrier protein] reductase|nr:MAG: SDR family NAD(P)-dependent oxidoreductase [Myxococcales bacterium]